MKTFDIIRQRAGELRKHYTDVKPVLADRPLDLVLFGLTEQGFHVSPLPTGHPLLEGADATLDWETEDVFFDSRYSGPDLAELLAHELGHVDLHKPVVDVETLEPVFVTLCPLPAPIPGGLSRVQGYGVKERRELQANVFAREFLFPRQVARQFFLGHQLRSSQIAHQLKLPTGLVRMQLADALLLPAPVVEVEPSVTKAVRLDRSQQAAVEAQGKPILVEAGPGTGKTRTLVKRVEKLIRDNVAPESILILTYSNKAAAELLERLSGALPNVASKVWAGTFHAFGLEVARRFHQELAAPPDIGVLDQIDSINLLEHELKNLSLKHFRNLWNPTLHLPEILSVISRAKDEMINAAQFEKLAQAALKSAPDDKARELAEQTCEVAQIYQHYEQLLKSRGEVDFGDLIMRINELLIENIPIRTMLQMQYRHILVDEYQDVNRASVRMVQLLAGDGSRLWVVGDGRQSIYRFRGASSINMARFEQDYAGGERLTLQCNYRSTPAIVGLYTGFSTQMAASTGLADLALHTERLDVTNGAQLRCFESPREEALGLAASIEELKAQGVAYKDQAVLGLTHTELAAVAEVLAQAGIPVLYLGAFFERSEVRDLLCVLDLLSGRLSALLRVAHFPNYGLDGPDVYRVLDHAKSENLYGMEAVEAAVSLVSVEGQPGLKRMRDDLLALDRHSHPWQILSELLFERRVLIDSLLCESSVDATLRRIAVWRLLRFVLESPLPGQGSRTRRLLGRVRQLSRLKNDRDLRQIPEEAGKIDAVTLMTVHASKGLEFEAVHLPRMEKGKIPRGMKYDRLLVPTGMIAGADGPSWRKEMHDTEQECLYFVAVSRARTWLRFYVASKEMEKNSVFLSGAMLWLHVMTAPPQATLDSGIRAAEGWYPSTDSRQFNGTHINRFKDCPRRYFYTHVLPLGGIQPDEVYVKAHACVQSVLRGAFASGTEPTMEVLLDELQQVWKKSGPVGAAYEADYQKISEEALATFLALSQGTDWTLAQPLLIDISTEKMQVIPDQLGLRNNQYVLRRIRTGKPAAKEADELIYTLYHLAGQTTFGAGNYLVEAVHLGAHSALAVEVTKRKQENRRVTTVESVRAILANHFPVASNTDGCARCAHFFLCPSLLCTPEKN